LPLWERMAVGWFGWGFEKHFIPHNLPCEVCRTLFVKTGGLIVHLFCY